MAHDLVIIDHHDADLGHGDTSLSVETEGKCSPDDDSGAWTPDDLEPTAHGLDPLAHLPQPEVTPLGAGDFGGAGGQAHTVVDDFDRHEVAADLDVDGRTSGASVLRDVDERLLQRLLEDVPDCRRQARRITMKGELDHRPNELAEIVHEPLEPIREGRFRQPFRREVPDELTDLSHHQPGVAVDVLELRVERRRRADPMQAPVELEADREGQLTE